jgi:hypothetical protein
MKTKVLALCAAAAIIVVAAGPAAAKSETVTISIDGFCNVETIEILPGLRGNTIVETGDSCDENFGVGVYAKIPRVGTMANFGWTSANSPGTVFDMVFTKPFATDGSGQVSLLYTQDGVNQHVIGPFTYEVVTGDAKPNKTGLKPITSLVQRK